MCDIINDIMVFFIWYMDSVSLRFNIINLWYHDNVISWMEEVCCHTEYHNWFHYFWICYIQFYHIIFKLWYRVCVYDIVKSLLCNNVMDYYCIVNLSISQLGLSSEPTSRPQDRIMSDHRPGAQPPSLRSRHEKTERAGRAGPAVRQTPCHPWPM